MLDVGPVLHGFSTLIMDRNRKIQAPVIYAFINDMVQNINVGLDHKFTKDEMRLFYCCTQMMLLYLLIARGFTIHIA